MLGGLGIPDCGSYEVWNCTYQELLIGLKMQVVGGIQVELSSRLL